MARPCTIFTPCHPWYRIHHSRDIRDQAPSPFSAWNIEKQGGAWGQGYIAPRVCTLVLSLRIVLGVLWVFPNSQGYLLYPLLPTFFTVKDWYLPLPMVYTKQESTWHACDLFPHILWTPPYNNITWWDENTNLKLPFWWGFLRRKFVVRGFESGGLHCTKTFY